MRFRIRDFKRSISASIDVSAPAILYGHVWRTSRTVYLLMLMIFISIYFFSVVHSDYELTGPIFLAQPILLLSLALCWTATGNIRYSIRVHLCLLYAVFSLASITLFVKVTQNIPDLEDYLRRVPEQQWNLLLRGILGPHGPVLFFLGLFGFIVLLIVIGTVAAFILRVKKIRGIPATIRKVDSVTKKAIAQGKDSPGMLRVINWSQWRGSVFAVLAAFILLMPLSLPGRESNLPSPGHELRYLIPEFLSWFLVLLTDRWYSFLVAFPIAFMLWRRARAYLSPEAKYVMERTTNPPVLLLRAFVDDHAAVISTDLWRRLLIIRKLSRRRLEEVAAKSLSRLGPFIAVSDPKNRAPQLGAFRAELKDDEWQCYVLKWINASQLIVMIAGTSTWVKWELEQISKDEKILRKLLLLFPPLTNDNIAERWGYVSEILKNTPWHVNMINANLRGALAVQFLDNGKLSIIKSRSRRETDYDIALRVGLYSICGQTAVNI